jgi:hypothetical protein
MKGVVVVEVVQLVFLVEEICCSSSLSYHHPWHLFLVEVILNTFLSLFL